MGVKKMLRGVYEAVHLHYYTLSDPNLPQICTASSKVYNNSILKQMQYRFAVNF